MPDTSVITAATQAVSSPDPVYQGMAWVGGIMALVLGFAKPVMGLIRQYRTDKRDNAIDDAATVSWNRMKEMIDANTKTIDRLSAEVDQVKKERDSFRDELSENRTKIAQIESKDAQIKILIERLEDKDRIIAQKEDELSERTAELRLKEEHNRLLMLEVLNLKDRIHELELKMQGKEEAFCNACQFSNLKKLAEEGAISLRPK